MIDFDDITVGTVVRLVIPKGYLGTVVGKELEPDRLVFVDYWKGGNLFHAVYTMRDIEIVGHEGASGS